MPQKKNPDALELIRGKTGRVFGAFSAMMMTLKALPLAYNKDMQEDKEGLFDAMPTWLACIHMAQACIKGIKVNADKTLAAAKGGHSNATELADYLVSKGVPFRTAHEVVGECVQLALKHQQPLEDLPLSTLQAVHSVIMPDVYEWLSIEALLANEMHSGAPALNRHKLRLRSFSKVCVLRFVMLRWMILMRLSAWSVIGRVPAKTCHEPKMILCTQSMNLPCLKSMAKSLGVASLYIYTTGLAEIRSLGVNPQSQVRGQGRMLVEAFVSQSAFRSD